MSGIGAGALRAGVGRSEITWREPGAAVHDPLYAKALVLDDGRTRVAIVCMDVVAIGEIGDVNDDFLPELRARIAGELGLPGAHVLVNASHTHPPGRLLVDHDEQVQRVFEAVAQAIDDLTPATVGVGAGHEDRIQINRTLRLKDGGHWTIRHANPCPPDEDVAGLGPIDPRIGILRFDRQGRPPVVVYHFACHPLIGVPGGAITANYVGFASQVIEQHLGEGGMALFVEGAAGDVCEVLYKEANRPRDARPLGVLLGVSTVKALAGIQTGPATLTVVNEPLDLPRRTDSEERIAAKLREQAELLASLRATSLNFRKFLPLYLQYALNPDFPSDYSYRYLHEESIGSGDLEALDAENRNFIAKYLNNIRAMEKLAKIQDEIATFRRHQEINRRAGSPVVATEVQGIRIGDCVLVTSPAEVLVEVAQNIQRESPFEHTWVAAFSNGYVHYGPPASYYDKSGYEVVECFLAPEWQALYEAKAAEVLGTL